MNFSLIHSILQSRLGARVTILRTDGHTYKKSGHSAFYEEDGIAPVSGNLGSLCADQEILEAVKKARKDNRPLCISVDTRDDNDGVTGYGTFCGGMMDLLIEPVNDEHRAVYAEVYQAIRSGKAVRLQHNGTTGELQLKSDDSPGDEGFFEKIGPWPRLFLFGATPLALEIVNSVRNLALLPCVIDWREAFLELYATAHGTEALNDSYPFDEHSIVIAVSHSYPRDLRAIAAALDRNCGFIGLLSSRLRRDRMLAELAEQGRPRAALELIRSPVGLDIGGGSDAEIAVAVAAQIVEHMNRC